MHYRLVKRNSLTELEAAVAKLHSEGWEFHNVDHGPTLAQALQIILSDENLKLGVAISMRREWVDE
jgi:hypothetical protein